MREDSEEWEGIRGKNLSYFSVAVIRNTEEIIGDLQFQRQTGMRLERWLRAYILIHKHEAERPN